MTQREPRPDLGVEITLFYHRDRNGVGRLTVRTKDIFGTPVDLEPEGFARMLEATARDVRGHTQKSEPDPLAREPHDWTAFNALIADVPPGRVQRARVLESLDQARAAFEAPEAMVVRMVRDGHSVEALTPNQFVTLWRKGYRP